MSLKFVHGTNANSSQCQVGIFKVRLVESCPL